MRGVGWAEVILALLAAIPPTLLALGTFIAQVRAKGKLDENTEVTRAVARVLGDEAASLGITRERNGYHGLDEPEGH